MSIDAAETRPWQEPAVRSPACARFLARIEQRRWRPAESTLWRPDAEAARRARMHEWEWRNLVLHGYCAQLADPASPDSRWPVERLPHCPNPVYEPATSRYFARRYIQALCTCPDPDAETWPRHVRAHWVNEDWPSGQAVELYCHCGGPENPPGSGSRWVRHAGFACEDCAPRLITTRLNDNQVWDYRKDLGPASLAYGPPWKLRLTCDGRCCYCGNAAAAGRGWSLSGHPPIAGPADG